MFVEFKRIGVKYVREFSLNMRLAWYLNISRRSDSAINTRGMKKCTFERKVNKVMILVCY